jgi:prepilin-type processing-associated H-X9-DG protein
MLNPRKSWWSVHQRCAAAFTLIELLVTIAILIIVAAMVFSGVGTMQRKAWQTASMSNLRQWGSALTASVADHNGEMPWEGQPVDLASTTRADAAWYNRLPRYIGLESLRELKTKNKLPRAGQNSVWVNPAVPKSDNAKYADKGIPEFFYAMNFNLSTSSSETNDGFTTNINEVVRTSALVFMGEKADEFANMNPAFVNAYFGSQDKKYGPEPWKTDPHAAANFLFCDGHVDLVERVKFNGSAAFAHPPDPYFTMIVK